MPAYNAEKYIADSIASVLAQSFTDFELIVVNDASSDRTLEICRKFAASDGRIRIICNERNLGVSLTRQKGANAAAADLLCFLDSDDLWLPDKLEQQLAFHLNRECALSFTASSFIDEKNRPYAYILQVPATITYEQLLKQNLISNSSVMIERTIYLEHLILEDQLHEDFVCWLRILEDGYSACGLNQPLLVYRISAASKSGNKLKSALMTWRSYRASGLGFGKSLWNLCFYTVNGLKKYKNFRRS